MFALGFDVIDNGKRRNVTRSPWTFVRKRRQLRLSAERVVGNYGAECSIFSPIFEERAIGGARLPHYRVHGAPIKALRP